MEENNINEKDLLIMTCKSLADEGHLVTNMVSISSIILNETDKDINKKLYNINIILFSYWKFRKQLMISLKELIKSINDPNLIKDENIQKFLIHNQPYFNIGEI